MMAVSCPTDFDPREFVTIKPLPSSWPSGEKLQTRNKTVYVTCHDRQMFWVKYRRRQRQLSRQGYFAATWRPYEEVGEPLYLEPKKLILSSLGQLNETPKNEVMASTTRPVSSSAAHDSTNTSTSYDISVIGQLQEWSLTNCHCAVCRHISHFHLKGLSFHAPKTRNREDVVNFKKHLGQTRSLLRAVRQGRGYFQLLQEAQETQEAKGKETWGPALPQPPRLCADTDSDSESPVSCGLLGSWSQSQTSSRGRCRTQSARPFTPMHRSLTTEQLHQVPPESVFVQLCCLNWLLEALTLGPSGRAAPVSTCWDPKDPGESRAAIKALTKEKAIQSKWEQFISVPKTPRRLPTRLSHASSGRSSLRKTSGQSRASSSLANTLTRSSLVSLAPETDGAGRLTATGEETDRQSVVESDAEPPVSEYLQKLLEEVYKSVAKDLYGPGTKTVVDFVGNSKIKSASAGNIITDRQDSPGVFKRDTPRPKSCHAGRLSATTRFINRKSSRLDELKASFEERAEELAQTFSDCLEAKAKKRWDSGLQRFQALSSKSTSSLGSDIHHHISLSKHEVDSDKPYSTQWLWVLLGNLTAAAKPNRKLTRVLEKLQRFAEERRLRVRPQVFLKVLGSLQPWELCLPDLCVAIEVVREHAVRMSREDYDAWLLTRISGPRDAQNTAPGS